MSGTKERTQRRTDCLTLVVSFAAQSSLFASIDDDILLFLTGGVFILHFRTDLICDLIKHLTLSGLFPLTILIYPLLEIQVYLTTAFNPL